MTAGALEGKVAISHGMGETAARVFAAAGAKVLAADVNPEVGQATVERIEREGGSASFCHADVSRAAGAVLNVDAGYTSRRGSGLTACLPPR